MNCGKPLNLFSTFLRYNIKVHSDGVPVRSAALIGKCSSGWGRIRLGGGASGPTDEAAIEARKSLDVAHHLCGLRGADLRQIWGFLHRPPAVVGIGRSTIDFRHDAEQSVAFRSLSLAERSGGRCRPFPHRKATFCDMHHMLPAASAIALLLVGRLPCGNISVLHSPPQQWVWP